MVIVTGHALQVPCAAIEADSCCDEQQAWSPGILRVPVNYFPSRKQEATADDREKRNVRVIVAVGGGVEEFKECWRA